MSSRLPSTLKFTVLALLAALAFYLVCQFTVAAWIARENQHRAALRAEGRTPWEWDFSNPESIVAPGSEGYSEPRFSQEGLSLQAPADGAVDLSLALRGDYIDIAAVDYIELELATDAKSCVTLLPHRGMTRPAWVEHWVEAGAHTLQVPTSHIGAEPAEGLQLRIDTAPGTKLHFTRLALRTSPATATFTTATDAATPERLLAFRDDVLRQSPSTLVQAPAPWQVPARALAKAQWLESVALLLPFACLLATLLALQLAHARLKQNNALSPRRAALELALVVLPCIALLLAGWPQRGANHPLAMLAFIFAMVSWLAPVPRLASQAPMRWIGDAAAWRDALFATLAAVVLFAPLYLLPDGDHIASRSEDRFWRYPLWALLQQGLLLFAIAPRCLHITRGNALAAAALSGVVFALLHLPNFALMLATLAGGMLWAMLGYKHRALLPLAVSHAALGLWITHAAPHWLLRSAEVGGRFLMAQ